MKSVSKSVKIRYIGILLIVSAVFLVIGAVWIDRTTSVRPKFSVESGFYDEAFYLEMSSQSNSIIYYTLDGSIPDENSLVYEEPIFIDNATYNENVYSMRTDVSTGFYTDLVNSIGQWPDPQYKSPDFLIDKCTIIRAVSITENGVQSEEANASYFVGLTPEEYNGCKIISLITAPDNLFDSKEGIYVTGDKFENGKDTLNREWRWWPANYRMRGREWEREAIFHFFDEKGILELSKAGGIRIHGGVSRATLPKGLNLYARTEYDGNETFDADLFNNNYRPKRITLASGGNQLITQFNDYMMTERVGGLNFATLSHMPYVLFINGEYWGFYWLNEKYDAEYIEYYYGVDADNVILVKNESISVGTEEEYEMFCEMEKFIQENDMADKENYDKLCEMIDIDSFIDYYATMIYIGRREDWPLGNLAAWRSREVTNEKYADGKWRWMLFDCNSMCMGNDGAKADFDNLVYMVKSIADRSTTFASLWESEVFRQKFQERILYIADECFDASEMSQYIDEYNTKMIPILTKSWERFYGKEGNQTGIYYDAMQHHKNFFNERKAEVESWFISPDL